MKRLLLILAIVGLLPLSGFSQYRLLEEDEDSQVFSVVVTNETTLATILTTTLGSGGTGAINVFLVKEDGTATTWAATVGTGDRQCSFPGGAQFLKCKFDAADVDQPGNLDVLVEFENTALIPYETHFTVCVARSCDLALLGVAFEIGDISTEIDANSADLNTIIADTNDLQTRVPAALVSGRIDASVGAAQSGAVTSIQTGLYTIPKNTAYNNFMFKLVSSTDNKTPSTGRTVSATRSIDGAAFAAGTLGAVSEVSHGWYKLNIPQADLNGDEIVLKFEASGANTVEFKIRAQR